MSQRPKTKSFLSSQNKKSNLANSRKRKVSESDESEDDYISSESESGGEDVLCTLDQDESDSDSDIEIPTKSFKELSKTYDSTQKKLEEHHAYRWLPGEKIYNDDLVNELLLSEKVKKEILEKSPVELFEIFFSIELKNYILQATNENGQVLDMTDLDGFLGILIFSSYNKRTNFRDYWSTDLYLGSEIVRQAMSRNKFVSIKSNLKFCLEKDMNEHDKVRKVRPILNIFRENIMKFVFFSTALSIDEMMLKFFGRLSIKQFIRAKPIRFGIKMWAVCSSDGYLFSFDVYCGKNSEEGKKLSNIAQGSQVVLQMINDLLTDRSPRKLSDFHLYFDNLFCSPDLLVHLKKLNVRATGVVRKDRIKEKNEIDKKAPKGTYIAKFDKNSGLNYITAKDSKNVSILTTATGVTPLTPMKRYIKTDRGKVDVPFPHVFSTYNKFMGGVDMHDQHCNRVLPGIRSKKWTWIPFIRIIQSSITNATILYNVVRDEKLPIKDTAIMISKDYLSRKQKPIVKNHSLERSPNSLQCSTDDCVIKTHKYCKVCESFFCDTCLGKKKICIEKPTPTVSSIIELENSATAIHTMIISDRKNICRGDSCEIRTTRFCKTCCNYVCKYCSDDNHKTRRILKRK